jgi:hypothetical protein
MSCATKELSDWKRKAKAMHNVPERGGFFAIETYLPAKQPGHVSTLELQAQIPVSVFQA